jgi:molybdopterin converting factor small subunit
LLAFARLREILGFGARELELDEVMPVTPERVWSTLAAERAGLPELRCSTRFARNGVLVDSTEPLADGDELALLPPVGGG